MEISLPDAREGSRRVGGAAATCCSCRGGHEGNMRASEERENTDGEEKRTGETNRIQSVVEDKVRAMLSFYWSHKMKKKRKIREI